MRNFFRQSAFFRSWRSQFSAFKDYFAIYGGLGALGRSPYVHVSVVIGVALNLFMCPVPSFSQIGLESLPNILGFTMGGMAIVLTVASSKIFSALSEKGEPTSFFMKMVVGFLHYIVCLVITLILCVVDGNGTYWLLNTVCAIFLVYCYISAVAIGVHLFRMAKIYNAHGSIPPDER